MLEVKFEKILRIFCSERNCYSSNMDFVQTIMWIVLSRFNDRELDMAGFEVAILLLATEAYLLSIL